MKLYSSGRVLSRAFFIIFILVLIWAIFAIDLKPFESLKLPPPELRLTKTFEINFDLKNLNEDEVKLEKIADGKILILNFWATWCAPCIIEMPSLQKLNNLNLEDVLMVCVTFEDVQKVLNFSNKYQFDLPFYLVSRYQIEGLEFDGLPTTFIISKNREIVYKHEGVADWSDPSVLNQLKELSRKK